MVVELFTESVLRVGDRSGRAGVVLEPWVCGDDLVVMMSGRALFRDLGDIVSDGTGCSIGCSELDLESAGDGLGSVMLQGNHDALREP